MGLSMAPLAGQEVSCLLTSDVGKRGRGMKVCFAPPNIKGAPSIPETYLLSSVAWGLNLRVG